MSTSTEATSRVVVFWGDDDEPWMYPDAGGEPGDHGEHNFTVDIPAGLWERVEAANRAYGAVLAEAIDAAGIDRDELRLLDCCPEWMGSVSPERVSYTVMLSASGRDDEWPLHDHALHYEQSHIEAQAAIDAMPEEFYVHYGAHRPALVRRDRLSIGRSGWPGSTSTCYRCGWRRDDHADKGTPR